MIRLLCRMNQARKASIDKVLKAFDGDTVRGYEREYDILIRKGHEENEKTPHKYAKSDEMNPLNRLEKYSRNPLLFLEAIRGYTGYFLVGAIVVNQSHG